MVELVNQLGFVQWQPTMFTALRRPVHEQVAGTGHVEQALGKADAPRIDFWGHFPRVFAFTHHFSFANQHGGGAVELFGQLGIALAAEHRAGAGVGVNQAEFVGREGEAAARVGGLCHLRGKADKFSGFGSAQRHQAEFVAAVNGRENGFTVFKVQ